MNSNNKTSQLVSSQLPGFVREEHETFVKFLEYYYKFMEQDGQVGYVSKNFLQFLDVDIIAKDIQEDLLKSEDHRGREDETYHIFLQKLYDTYIKLIPDKVIADKTLLLKHAKEFYSSTGTEKSLRYLMNALFGKSDVNIYYPKRDVLRASDGKWFIEKSLKIADIKRDNVANSIAVNNFVNHRIVGANTNASATIESVDIYYEKGELVTELKLSGLVRDFEDGETIFTYYVEEGNEYYLTATLFGGVVTTVQIITGGSGYVEGTYIPVESNTGSGAQIVVSKTTKGGIVSIGVVKSGAGFRVADPIVIAGGGGTGATANVTSVNKDASVHPNSYTLTASTISLEANTPIGNARYSNLVNTVTDPANSWVSNSMTFWTFANTGPLVTCFVINPGQNYTSFPAADVVSNTVIRSLGILGRIEIQDGGFGYQVNDPIEFINRPFTWGSGAQAKVTEVDPEGTITKVRFVGLPGQFVGGSGYDQSLLPYANVVSANANAYGANISVITCLGDGEELIESLSTIGTILELKIISGGKGYKTAPTINLASHGDGTAQAVAEIVTGVYTYPGRYLNDDGMISAYNFLQDRDYYQNYSYVVKIDEPVNKYKKYVKDLLHPAGMKFFGEYNYGRNFGQADAMNVTVKFANTSCTVQRLDTQFIVEPYYTAVMNVVMVKTTYEPEIKHATFLANTSNTKMAYIANGSVITINYVGHGYSNGDVIATVFANSTLSNASANLVNGYYTIAQANANVISIVNPDFTANLLFGNVFVYNPLMSITSNNHGYHTGDQVYLKFQTSDTAYQNTTYTIGTINANTINVRHSDIANATVNSGSVNVHSNTIIINYANHAYSKGETIYLKFATGDTGNVSNGHQFVKYVTGNNTFNVATPHPVSVGGNVYVHTQNVIITLNSHGAANSDNVYIVYYTGDTANSVNAAYNVNVLDANRFSANVSKVLASNGMVRIYYSNTTYTDVKFIRENHGFLYQEKIVIEFDSAISNGIFNINTVTDSNTYNITHPGITIANGVSMHGIATIGLYK